MTIVHWPSTLPQAGRANVSGGPQRNVVSFTPEIGPSIDRRRASSTGRTRDVTMPYFTLEEYETFVSFVEIDLHDGVLPFIWVDPISGRPAKVKLVQDDPLYMETKLKPDQFEISFKLFVMRIQ